MRTLKQIQRDIEAKRAKLARRSSFNVGVIRGALDNTDLTMEILADVDEYNRRSKRNHYENFWHIGKGQAK